MDLNEVEFGGYFFQKKEGFLHRIIFSPGVVGNFAVKIEGSCIGWNDDKQVWVFLGGNTGGLTIPFFTDPSDEAAEKLVSLGVEKLTYEEVNSRWKGSGKYAHNETAEIERKNNLR